MGCDLRRHIFGLTLLAIGWLAAPSGLFGASCKLALTWVDNSNDEDGFKIERATSSAGPWIQIAQVGPDQTNYLDTTVIANSTYYYRVRAYNSQGDSAYSNIASGNPPCAVTLDSVGDGIQDLWRAQYFGGDGTTTNSLSCANCDADGTGQKNLFKYEAGLDPTNPASIFVMTITSVTGQPAQKLLRMNPITAGRTYTVEYSTNLVGGGWLPLTTYANLQTNSASQLSLIDTNAVQQQKFYRVRISQTQQAIASVSVSDGIPSSWRAQYFGGDGTTTNSLSCASCDADGTGQSNLFKYLAGLDPTNPVSVFTLRITSVAGQPTQKQLTFRPWAPARTYTLEYRTNLVSGSYVPLSSYSGPQTNAEEVTVIDTIAVEPQRFYRIRISMP
jgi:hypothetical protein